MKVLVATNQSQGVEQGDYCFALDGELVLSGPSLECDRAERCRCARGFPGLGSCQATTTAMVVDRPEIDRTMLADVVRDTLDRQGSLLPFEPTQIDELVDHQVVLIEHIAAAFAVGAVLRRDGTEVWEGTRRAA